MASASGTDDGADVAPIQHRAAVLRGESALLLNQHTPHLRDCGDARCGIGHRVGGQQLAVERAKVDEARCFDGMRRIVQRPTLLQHHMRNGAIGEAGVEMRQVVIVGDAPGERALAGCSRAVNCDGEVHAGASIMKSRREQPGTVG